MKSPKHLLQSQGSLLGLPKSSLLFYHSQHSLPRCHAKGDHPLSSEAKRRMDLFSRIVPVYDQINDVMSLGQHREWKKLCVRYSGVMPGSSALDVCCGSGDLTQLLAQKVGIHGKVVGLDFSSEMLKIAKEKDLSSPSIQAQIQWVEGDARNVEFPDDSFDAVTIGYGLRNVVDIQATLKEMRRVLKSSGKLSVLDFNNSSNFFVDAFQAFALNGVVVPVARLVGMEDEYKYLHESIKEFPSGGEQESLCMAAGFRQAKHFEIASGLMGILIATK